MAITIFYSWQSDLSNKLNRNFIEDALEKAIKKLGQEMEIQEALRDEDMELDKDTKGIPGTPPIVEVIFNKISKCGVFVPDLTFVGKSINGRLLPNPNVLVEYGWALKALSHSRILSVMNSAFGEPSAANMPFDMRHLRNPITYHLDETVIEEERTKIKDRLVKDLYIALETIVKSGILTQSDENQKEFDNIPSTSNPSTFLQPGETFIDNRLLRPGTKEIVIPEVQRLFLRLIPRKPLDNIRSSKAALDLARNGNLMPMSEMGVSCSYGRNKYGSYVCFELDGKILNMTQLFKSGEMWGIDSDCLDKNRLMQHANVEFGFFPCSSLESIFVWTLSNYLKFANDMLKLPLPLKLIAGATDVLGYRMAAPYGMRFRGFLEFDGNVFESNIIFEELIEDYSIKPRTILRPFFEYVWEECGLERPDQDKL